MSFLNFIFKNKYNDRIKVVSPDKFKSILHNSKVQLIDVRTPSEFKFNRIKGAKNINYHSRNFVEEIKKLDRDKPVMLYCKSGVRSRRSAKKLAKMGFEEIYDLKGGIMNWP